VLLCWPIAHFAFGRIERWLGGSFWIEVDGFQGTLLEFLQGLVGEPRLLGLRPFVVYGAHAIVSMPWAVALVAMIVAAGWMARGHARRDLLATSVRLAAFVTLAALIDWHTPVSTERNYIALLPATALLFGTAVDVFWHNWPSSWRRAAVAACVALFGFEAYSHGLRAMELRWTPRENWTAMAESINDAGTCRPHCWFVSSSNLHEFYFETPVDRPWRGTLRTVDELIGERQESVPVVALRVSPTELTRLRKYHLDWSCAEPPQAYRRSIVILLPPSSRVPAGLRPCS
jgi:hypothetical protein